MAKFYAVGYTNGGANEKRLGPYNTMDEARKAGMREQAATRGFAFAGVVGEDGNYVYSNSCACNAIYQGSRVKYVGDDPRWKGMTGIVLRVKDNSEDNRENYYWVDFPGRPSLPESDLVANSRVCNSSNPVVRKAIAANSRVARNAAFDDGSVLVSFKTMGPSKMDAIQKRMSSRDFKAWLEKTGNGSKAQEIWYALMQGDEYSFLSGATRVRVKAL